jgi:hypothetical protein
VVTSGTVGRALATVICTVPPLGSVVPFAGFCARTVPGGLELSFSVDCICSPAPSINCRAPSSVLPTTSGTATPDWPFETVRVTVRPLVACLPGSGETEMTLPSGTESENASVTLALKPASRTAWTASSRDWPTTSGTAAVPRPPETVTVIVVPSRTSSPASGSWEMTSLVGTLSSSTVT